MKKKHYAIFGGLIAIIMAMILLRPVPIPDEKDCLILRGTVSEVYEGGVRDVVLKLRGHSQSFYVNRGLERGLNLKRLQANLTGREIVLKYPDHWSPFDPNKTSIHVSKIEFAGETVFTEME